MTILAALGAFLQRMVGWSGADGWRRRREQFLGKAKPSYDAYPSRDLPPEVRFYVEARDVRGRLRREYVELDGYSVHQLNWKTGAMRGGTPVRDWFVNQMLEALIRLMVRVDETKEAQDASRFDEGTGAR